MKAAYEVQGQLPPLANIAGGSSGPGDAVMRKIADLMYKSVGQNFSVGGRPTAWPPLKTGGPSFLGGKQGGIFRAIRKSNTANTATVGLSTSQIRYARIHQFGGTIQHPGSSKFQVFMWKGRKVFTWFTKRHKIPMRQRTFLLFQDEDVKAINALVTGAIFSAPQRTNKKG
jgi:phage gpG-like protein